MPSTTDKQMSEAEMKLQEIYESALPIHKEMILKWKEEGQTEEQILPYAEIFM